MKKVGHMKHSDEIFGENFSSVYGDGYKIANILMLFLTILMKP